MDDLKKKIDQYEKELTDAFYKAFDEKKNRFFADSKFCFLHPAEQLLIELLRKKIKFGTIKKIEVYNGLPCIGEYEIDESGIRVVRKVRFLAKREDSENNILVDKETDE